MEPLVIDGSFGEGGGQILRTSCTLAAITGRPIEIHSIRGKRPKPGLQAQHLVAVLAAAELCNGELKGAAKGSMFLSFIPTKPAEPGEYRFDIGTAGSTTLVLQTVFPILSVAGGPSRVTITGGTHNPKAPTFDYIDHVYVPSIRPFGWNLRLACPTPGFFPAGGGRVEAEIELATPRPIDLTVFPAEHDICSIAHTSIMGRDLLSRTRNTLAQLHDGPMKFEEIANEGPSPGVGLTLVASNEHYRAGFSELGERGVRMETVCERAYSAYDTWRKSPPALEEHLADQLAPLAALTEGESRWRAQVVSEHLRTVLQVIQWFGLAETELNEETGEVRVIGRG